MNDGGGGGGHERLRLIDEAFEKGDLDALRAAVGDPSLDPGSISAILERTGAPRRRRLRPGLMLLWELPGSGEPVRRQHVYRLRLRLWLHRGEPVRWRQPSGFIDTARLEDDGATLLTDVRLDRRSLVPGLFYGIDGMRLGGTRALEIAPHLGYGEAGVSGIVPPDALLSAEVTVIGARPWPPRSGS